MLSWGIWRHLKWDSSALVVGPKNISVRENCFASTSSQAWRETLKHRAYTCIFVFLHLLSLGNTPLFVIKCKCWGKTCTYSTQVYMRFDYPCPSCKDYGCSTTIDKTSSRFRNLERGVQWKFLSCHAHFWSHECIHDWSYFEILSLDSVWTEYLEATLGLVKCLEISKVLTV